MPFRVLILFTDVIVPAKFYVDPLKGFWEGAPPKVPFPILFGTVTTVLHYRADCDYTSNFDFGPTVVIGVWFGIGQQILPESDDRWRSCDVTSISKMAATASQIYFRFQFGDVSHLRTSKSIRIPNLAKIAHCAADILLFPVSENKWPPYWNSSACSHFDVFDVIGMWFCIGVPNFV